METHTDVLLITANVGSLFDNVSIEEDNSTGALAVASVLGSLSTVGPAYTPCLPLESTLYALSMGLTAL